MIAFVLMLALAAASRVELTDEVYTIPAEEWRYLEIGLKQQAALVVARYDLEGAGTDAQVRVALMRREDMEHFREGLPHGMVEATAAGHGGTLRAHVPAGDYVLVVDNRATGGRPVAVHLHVWLDFSNHVGPVVTTLPAGRQFTVILISFAVFFGVVAWGGRKLLQAVSRNHESR